MSHTCSAITVRDSTSPRRPASSREQGKLFRCQVDRLAGAAGLVPEDVDLEILDVQRMPLGARRAPAHDRSNAGQQLGKRERFDQVVVGPDFQSLDAVRHGVARGEKQHGGQPAGGPHVREHRPAVAPRQHDVENHDVVFVIEREMQAIVAVFGDVHDKAVFGEPRTQVGSRLGLVLDDQHLHAPSLWPADGAVNRRPRSVLPDNSAALLSAQHGGQHVERHRLAVLPSPTATTNRCCVCVCGHRADCRQRHAKADAAGFGRTQSARSERHTKLNLVRSRDDEVGPEKCRKEVVQRFLVRQVDDAHAHTELGLLWCAICYRRRSRDRRDVVARSAAGSSHRPPYPQREC